MCYIVLLWNPKQISLLIKVYRIISYTIHLNVGVVEENKPMKNKGVTTLSKLL